MRAVYSRVASSLVGLCIFSSAFCGLELRGQESTGAARDNRREPNAATPEVTAARKQISPYLRIVSQDGAPKSLDTSIRTFRSSDPNGVTVDLIGAVHIGERDYYEKLNQAFDSYDVLLYELVAPEGTVIPKGGKRESPNPLSMLQDSAKSMLGLESQLERIDYTKPHFVRADMTPEQIGRKMKERGDTPVTVALSAFADILREQNLAQAQSLADGDNTHDSNPYDDIGLFDLIDNPVKLKRMMAWQFAQTGSLDQSLGKTLNQMLIVDRNAEALRALQKQIAAGKKKIGIFYGAAHMVDFEQHLTGDLGLLAQDPSWIAAWDLTKSTSRNSTSSPISMMKDLLKLFE